MLNQKTAAKHEEANALAAAAILQDRASQPVVMVLWAERVQCRQRSEKAQDSQHGDLVPTTGTAAPPQRQQRDQRATTAPPMAQRQLPLPLQGFRSST